MKVIFIPNIEETKVLIAHRTAHDYGIKIGRQAIKLGSFEREVNINLSGALSEGTIGLPKQWAKRLTIPDNLSFEVKYAGNTLSLGPVIALIVDAKINKRKKSRLKQYIDYFSSYDEIKGIVYLCAWKDIDIKKKRIKGYCYYPGKSDDWQYGSFPFPDAAYIRTAVPTYMYKRLRKAIGNRVFNSVANGSFNKWTLWRRLSKEAELSSYLPDTFLVKNVNTLEKAIERYKTVYVKPAMGTLSKGIMKIDKKGSGYLLTKPNRKRKGEGTKQSIIENRSELKRWFKGLKEEEYIAQQALNKYTYKARPIDFRVILQKDELNQWKCSGIFGKFGKKGSIITNFTRSGYIRSAKYTFLTAYKMKNDEAQNKMKEIEAIALKICKAFNKHGNYGDLGIDLIVDTKWKIWILEVNTLDTYHKFPLHIGDQALYKHIVSSPFRYAKYLAGF